MGLNLKINKSYLLIFIISLITCNIFAHNLFKSFTASTVNTINHINGNINTYQRLKPENEAFIRKIISELGMDENTGVYKMSAHDISLFGRENAYADFLLNSIFISEDFFEELSYNEKRFLIGHELLHLVRNHALKKRILSGGALIIGIVCSKKLANFIINQTKDSSYEKEFSNYSEKTLLSVSTGLAAILLKYYSRVCEYDADLQSAKKLGPHAIFGGISLFRRWQLSNYHSNSWLANLFSTHPNLKDRIEQLEKYAKEANIDTKLVY